MITKEEATILKAISIVSIILSHFWGWICPLPIVISTFASSISRSGVEIFLFLSGYGLMCSYKNNALRRFWVKRFQRIYIPLLLVTVPQLILSIWLYRNNIGDMYITSTFLSALGLYPNNLLDGTLWFVPFVLLQYTVFYSSFKWTDKRKYNYCFLIVGTLLVYILFKKYFTWVNECDIYAFAFLFGIIYTETKSEMKFSSVGIVISTILFVISTQFLDINIVKYINEISLVIVEIGVVKICVEKMNKKMQVLYFLGKISYELYLTEGIFFWHKIIYDVIGYHYGGLLIHMLVIIIFAMLIQKVSNIIIGMMRNKVLCYED